MVKTENSQREERRRGKERNEIFVVFNVVLVIDIIRLKQEISQKTTTFVA